VIYWTNIHVAGLHNKLPIVFSFGPDWSGRISTLVKSINDYQVLLYVYQVQNGSDRNVNETVIGLSIDILIFHKNQFECRLVTG
jgi:hypothetical protein